MLREVAYSIDGHTYRGYLADGSQGTRVPGILVIHGGGGLGAHAKQRTEKLAEAGYVAFAADLFGRPVDGLDDARALVEHFTHNWRELRARCMAGLDVLRKQPHVDADRLAVIGFCFGGQAAVELGRSGAPIRAIVGFHSQLRTERPDDSAQIKAKVLICVGDQDCFVSRSERETFMENMTASHVDCQLLLFSGVHHSFTDPFAEASGVPGLKYDALADQRSWRAMNALFAEVFSP
jgi:dienelactone hydrolase